MELILVRHALPQRIVGADGAADPALTERGHAQAERVAAWLAQERIDAVYASPLRRARQTAEHIAAACGSLPVHTLAGLAEYDADANEYIPIEELKATNHPHWQAMQRGEWVPGGTDPAQFVAAIEAACAQIIAGHPRQRVVAACHGGVINAFCAAVIGSDRTAGFFHPEYTSISRVLASSGGVRSVHSLNEVPHLRGTGLLDP